MALVHRSVVNGWDVPQGTKDQIGEQLSAAFDFYGREYDGGSSRAAMHLVKLAKLALLMDVSNSMDAGERKSLHPFGRKRNPEKRQPRRLSAASDAGRRRLEAAIERLAETRPQLAAGLRDRFARDSVPSMEVSQ